MKHLARRCQLQRIDATRAAADGKVQRGTVDEKVRRKLRVNGEGRRSVQTRMGRHWDQPIEDGNGLYRREKEKKMNDFNRQRD